MRDSAKALDVVWGTDDLAVLAAAAPVGATVGAR
jgi:hypothetical protein